MDKDKITALGERMIEAVRRYVSARTDSLEARIKKLEASQLRYRGVWSEGDAYRENDICSHAGTIWIVEAGATQDRPGTSNAWRMMAKNR